MVSVESIKRIIEEKLKHNIASEDEILTNVGADSVTLVEIVVELEKKFEVEFSDQFLNKLLRISINDIVNEIGKMKDNYFS